MARKRKVTPNETAAEAADERATGKGAEQVTFEQAISALSDAVRRLEEGSLTLDESLASYEAGIRHLSQCQKLLSAAERKIAVLSGFDADGKPVTQPFDDESMTLQEKAESRSRRRTAKPHSVVKSVKRPPVKKAANKSSSTSPATTSEEQGDVDLGGTLF